MVVACSQAVADSKVTVIHFLIGEYVVFKCGSEKSLSFNIGKTVLCVTSLIAQTPMAIDALDKVMPGIEIFIFDNYFLYHPAVFVFKS